MFYHILIKVALKSLMANRMRSFLAVLGIIIGVAAVISMLALGSGAQAQVLERIQAMGTNLLIVRSGMRGMRAVRADTEQDLTIEDAEAILKRVPGVKMLSPVVQNRTQFTYLQNSTVATVQGTSVTYFPIRNYEIDQGRIFTETEVKHQARVAVLGPDTSEALFGEDDPLNQTIRIHGKNFLVVGVLKPKGDQGFFNPDNQAIIPYTTSMKQIFGQTALREIDIQIAPRYNQSEVQSQIELVLREQHRLLPHQDNDFHVRNQAELVQTATEMTQTFTILLGSVAAISLLVGGIGIMNIMLVTVIERTREIGIRKAIGAQDSDVLLQFLLEAVLMSGIGGLLGAGLGISIALLITHVTQYQTIIEPFSVLIALLFSSGVGIFFGFYPARRAAQLDPIDALQYE